MKIIIDEQVCLKHKLTVAEVVKMLAVRLKADNTLSNLESRGITEHGKLTDEWSSVLDRILKSSGSDRNDEERLKALAKQMQKCFPEGKVPGTPYYYRCNSSEIVKKLRRFFERHGNYSDEQIIDATKRFIASFNANYRYLPLLKYFISKLKTVQDEDGIMRSVEYFPLADFLENQEDVEDNDDWLVSINN